MKIRLIPLIAALAIAGGCGKEDDSVAKKAGTAVGGTLTDFASGVGKGIDKQMAVNVELSPDLVNRGLRKTVAKSVGIDQPNDKGITVYLLSTEPLEAKLIARAFNSDSLEIGRCVVDAAFAADDGKYLTFQFDAEMDSQLVERYVLDIKK